MSYGELGNSHNDFGGQLDCRELMLAKYKLYFSRNLVGKERKMAAAAVAGTLLV